MKLHVVAFGKLKTPGLRDAADYYQKILKPWVPIQETELKPQPVPDKSPATRAKIQQLENKLLQERLGGLLSARGGYYLLDEIGTALHTRDWAKTARSWQDDGTPEIALCIGSSLGFSAELRGRARGI